MDIKEKVTNEIMQMLLTDGSDGFNDRDIKKILDKYTISTRTIKDLSKNEKDNLVNAYKQQLRKLSRDNDPICPLCNGKMINDTTLVEFGHVSLLMYCDSCAFQLAEVYTLDYLSF